jgi:hypothetical protein
MTETIKHRGDADTSAVYPLDGDTLYLPPKQAAEIGRRYAEKYQSGQPYHYIAIDDFIPRGILEKVRQEALSVDEKPPEHVSEQEHLKASYSPDVLPHYSRLVFNALNSQSFIRFLEEMSGIDGLITDPYFKGGGHPPHRKWRFSWYSCGFQSSQADEPRTPPERPDLP